MESPYVPDDSNVPSELQQSASLLGLSLLTHLKGGHTEAVLYRAVDSEEIQRVMKIGSVSGINIEVDANTFGYNSIRREGAESLLPENMTFGEIEGHRYIIMPYLGTDITQRDRIGDIDAVEYAAFVNKLVSTISETVEEHEGPERMRVGLEAMHAKLQQWFNQLIEKGAISQEEVNELMDIEITELTSNKSSLMIMDFTPDNTFFDGKKVSFIDPWKQTTYRGSFIPPLRQFVTLATEIYALPHAQTAQESLSKSIDEVGHLLDLTPHQIHAQGMLGNALQYALSGFVRLESDPAQSDKYIRQAKEAIYLLKSDIIRLKKERL